MKKSIYFLALMPFLFSCTKELNNPSKEVIEQQAQFVSSTSISHAVVPVNWGVKFGDGTSVDDGIQVLKKLSAPYIRTSESLKNYKGGKVGWLEKGYSSGVKVILTICWEDAGSEK